jgi:hypothetical protein
MFPVHPDLTSIAPQRVVVLRVSASSSAPLPGSQPIMGSAYPLALSEKYKQAQRAFAALLETNTDFDLYADVQQLAAARSLYRLSRSELGTLARWLGWQLVVRTRVAQRVGMNVLTTVNARLENAVERELTRLPLAQTTRSAAPMRLSA